jgi:two-component system chemotaxis sensor kinase CheA
MSRDDDEFQKELEATFKVEAEEHLQAISAGLLELGSEPPPEQRVSIVERVFRAAHSLKGAARSVDLMQVEASCQSLEDVFASWKRGDSVPNVHAIDGLQRTADGITSMLAQPGASTTSEIVAPLRASSAPWAPPAAVSARPAATPVNPPRPGAAPENIVVDRLETVRVPVAKLEARLLESEEMLSVKLTATQRVADLRALASRLAVWRHAWGALGQDIRNLRQHPVVPNEPAGGSSLAPVLDFLESGLDTLKAIEDNALALVRVAARDRNAADKLVGDLLSESKKLLLLPVGAIVASFPKLVRDLCLAQGKDAELKITGDDIRVDKRILEEIKDPLIHLLRNSVDHGIETPVERTRGGKPSRAAITLAVSQLDATSVEIVLSDDGAGIDLGSVKEVAISRHVISEAEAERLADAAALELIFASGLSTNKMITDLSGRGLGLAIVREKAEKLGGQVAVQTEPGKGTTFRIVVPATRATFRGVVVEAAGQVLVVPTVQIECVTRAKPDDIRTVESRETISLKGRAVPLVRLADVLELAPSRGAPPSFAAMPLVVLGSGDQRVAFAVDAVLDEHEVIVKPLRKPLSRVRNIAAATVLASGRIAPILNVADLLKSARCVALTRASSGLDGPAEAPDPAGLRILLAEDSITSRMLLKAMLQSGGYQVKTAVDGMEAFTLLRSEPFDLLVSDVEMPRLNGFDLTARVRADPKLSRLPVVLVTALDTREHRERGVDVGANAYLVKSSVEQSNLLETVQRLI